MIIALTGTPGAGKSSVAGVLERRGYRVINLVRIAVEKGFTLGYDEERECHIIDMDKLNEWVKGERGKGDVVLDSHLSHLIGFVDIVVVLRCRPDVLKGRLEARGWKKRKIEENVEAEALDVILAEAVEIHGMGKVFEIDTTEMGIEEVADVVDGLIRGGVDREKFKPGKIDWSWYLVGEDGA